MKKRIRLFLCLTLIAALAGCGDSGMSERAEEQSVSVSEEASFSETDTVFWEASVPEGLSASDDTLSNTEGIDVDLTILSRTMVYSEVYNMMITPGDYMGKTVKMKGSFNYYYDEATDNDYFTCIIQDATACCAQGIEFVLTEDYHYPEDYPQLGSEITVVGVFDTYMEGGLLYCTLRNAKLV
ncbi:MAG: lipoprotein [Lachnospiraceae bacterium]